MCDLSRRHTLKWLSHPGSPHFSCIVIELYKQILKFIEVASFSYISLCSFQNKWLGQNKACWRFPNLRNWLKASWFWGHYMFSCIMLFLNCMMWMDWTSCLSGRKTDTWTLPTFSFNSQNCPVTPKGVRINSV